MTWLRAEVDYEFWFDEDTHRLVDAAAIPSLSDGAARDVNIDLLILRKR